MRVIFAAMFCLGFSSVLTANLPHYTAYKSFETAFRECGVYHLVCNSTIDQYIKDGYPKSEEVKELIYCTLINIRGYDPDTGVIPNVMQNYFHPNPTDFGYKKRTQHCLSNLLTSGQPCDLPSQAYAIFLCYFHQYGNIVKSDQFMPCTRLEVREVLTFTQSVQNLPYCVIEQYSNGSVLSEDHFQDVLYTWGVRTAYYTPGEGISLPYLYTTYGIPELLSEKTAQCTARVAREYCNAGDISIMWYTFIDCLRAFLPVDKYVEAFAQDEVKALACTTGQRQKPSEKLEVNKYNY